MQLDFAPFRIGGHSPLEVFDGDSISFADAQKRLETLQNRFPQGGAIGYFAYEAAREWEPRAFVRADKTPEIPPFRLVAFEKLRRETPTSFAGETAEMGAPELENARRFYEDGVAQIREYIAAGEFYQANLTHRIETSTPFSAAQIYARLAGFGAAPRAALLQWDDFSIVSNSPETFLTLRDGTLESRPIKGTAPLSQNPQTLQNDPKNRAENVMIVDLLRNDLGRVCEFGSVHVPQLCEIETFPTLHHLVSTVRGTLRENCTMFDAFRAAFPCGSITGAPKIRAMQRLDELEPTPRGVSMGAIGYFGFDGTMEWSVAIRTATIFGQRAVFHVGGGITTDSAPREEFEEMRLKARALWSALKSSP